jgi:BolA protein
MCVCGALGQESVGRQFTVASFQFAERGWMVSGRRERIATALRAAFSPASLEVVDDSARHAGHSGARAGGETHFNVAMVAQTFAGLSRVERSRRVHEALAEEFSGGLHALSLRLRSPNEINSEKAVTPT